MRKHDKDQNKKKPNDSGDPGDDGADPPSNDEDETVFSDMSKDPANAPQKISLSKKIHSLSQEALEQTAKSGEEYGFFLHLDETGQILPGEVKPPSEKAGEGEWITLEEYIALKKQDPSIHGLLHTHPKSTTFPGAELTFSEGNLGTFLEVGDTLLMCKEPQGSYLLALRTHQTPPKQKGLGTETTRLYVDTVRAIMRRNLEKGMNDPEAITQAVFETMKVICKKYNIVLYKGEAGKPAEKVS